MFKITFSSLSFFFNLLFTFSGYSFSIMARNASDIIVGPAVPLSGVEDASQVTDANAASGTWIVDIDIDCVIPK